MKRTRVVALVVAGLVAGGSSAVVSQLGAGAATPDPTAAEARRTAHEILQQAKYRAKPPPPGPLERLGTKVKEWLRDIMPKPPRAGSFSFGGGSALQWVVWIGVIALVVFTAVMLIRRSRRRTRTADDDDEPLDDAFGDDLGPLELERDPAVLERAALDAESRGDYDLAIRLRFRAGLLRLDAAGALRFSPSMTSGQVVRAVEQSPSLPAVARQFDSVAYGDHHVGSEEAGAATEAWARILSEVSP